MTWRSGQYQHHLSERKLRMFTLEQLRDAYKTGTLTPEQPLWIDNDHTAAYGDDDRNPVFEMDPAELLGAALDLLGIPHEHV